MEHERAMYESRKRIHSKCLRTDKFYSSFSSCSGVLKQIINEMEGVRGEATASLIIT